VKTVQYKEKTAQDGDRTAESLDADQQYTLVLLMKNESMFRSNPKPAALPDNFAAGRAPDDLWPDSDGKDDGPDYERKTDPFRQHVSGSAQTIRRIIQKTAVRADGVPVLPILETGENRPNDRERCLNVDALLHFHFVSSKANSISGRWNTNNGVISMVTAIFARNRW
jgi:hypothetical protein